MFYKIPSLYFQDLTNYNLLIQTNIKPFYMFKNVINSINSYAEIKGENPTRSSISNLYKWGTLYSSKTNVITFNFSFSSFKPTKIKLQTSDSDVYPIEWTISGSNDYSTFDSLLNKNEELCSETNKIKMSYNAWRCKIKEMKEYQIKSTNYYQFLQFKMNKNSFYDNDDYYTLIVITGIDFDGYFKDPFLFTQFSHNKNINTISGFSSLLFVILK